MKTYEKDYADTDAEIEELLHKIDALYTRRNALKTLIQADYPHKGRLILDQSTTPVQALVNVAEPRVTARVRGILTAYHAPLTCGEIHERLKEAGLDLHAKSNPWALIHGICRRLVDQKFAREVEKDGKKAWVVTE